MDKARCKNEPWHYPKKKPETVEKPVNTVSESAVQIPLVSSERRFIQHGLGSGHPKIPKGERHDKLCSKAGTWISSGMPRDAVEFGLIRFTQNECEDGHNYATEHKKEMHRIAYSPTLRFGGTYVGGKKGEEKIVFELQAVTRHQLLLECARAFPDGLSAVERYERFAKALEGSGYAIDKTLSEDRQEIRRVRMELGFVVRGTTFSRWYRNDRKGVCNTIPDQSDKDIDHLEQEETKKISVCVT